MKSEVTLVAESLLTLALLTSSGLVVHSSQLGTGLRVEFLGFELFQFCAVGLRRNQVFRPSFQGKEVSNRMQVCEDIQ